MRTKKDHDHFSYGLLIYASFFLLAYRTLFQLSYAFDGTSDSEFIFWAYVLIIVHIFGLIWCVIACLLYRMPAQLLSFICAASLVVGLEFLSPDSMKVYFWLHKDDFLARVATAQASHEGRLSIFLYSYGTYMPGLAYSHICPTEIVYDNSNDVDLISHTEYGLASVRAVGDNFYFLYLGCS